MSEIFECLLLLVFYIDCFECCIERNLYKLNGVHLIGDIKEIHQTTKLKALTTK